LRQCGYALFPDSPHFLDTPPPDVLGIGVDPGLHIVAVQSDFVVPDLLGHDRFFIQRGNRFRGLRTEACDVDALPRIRQVAVGFWERRQAIAFQNRTHPWSITLVHGIDAQREDNREALLACESREERMFGATGPVPYTNGQSYLPGLGKKPAYTAKRTGVADRFPAPSVRQTVEVDLQLIDCDDALLRALELSIVETAKHHDSQTFYHRRAIPGVGQILTLVLLYAIHDITRFRRVREFVSYARLVKCPRESAGKRSGTGGHKIGNVHLKWGLSEAAVLFLRNGFSYTRSHLPWRTLWNCVDLGPQANGC
jgi:Transposase IS116/IS110/IS902 family